jgi:hypothetical protein
VGPVRPGLAQMKVEALLQRGGLTYEEAQVAGGADRWRCGFASPRDAAWDGPRRFDPERTSEAAS